MARNPFLPKLPKKPTQWRVGAAKGTVGLPALQPLPKPENLTTPAWRKDPSGRKPKAKTALPEKPAALDAALVPVRPSFPNAGRLSHHWGVFLFESTAGWGSNLDMVALAHGPVGCGAFAQSFRPNMPCFIQGIESFTALHACTGLTHADLEESGDTKLERALDEINALFPLSRGVTVLNQDPAVLVGANIYGIAKTKTKQLGKLILTPSKTTTVDEDAVALKAALKHHKALKPSPYDIAIPFMREATGLVWPVAKLLRDIGLNPVHEYTGSSTSELARIASCRLVLGFGVKLDFPQDHLPNSAPQRLRRWFGMQLVWTCFTGPAGTDASLRAIAAHFDRKIQQAAERVIAANRQMVDAVIAHYRPRLEGKLVLDLDGEPESLHDCYRMLGFRVGTRMGWLGKTGVWRTPRLAFKGNDEKTIDSYIAEAKPDYVIFPQRDASEWRKRGQIALPFSPFLDQFGNCCWGYDGFACFAAALDRAINAPWRKLLKPPWQETSG